MKKLSIVTVASLVVVLSGCAAPVKQGPTQMVDNEPILVGKPITQKIFETSQSIEDQLALLNKVQHGGHVGNYAVVEHNNKLDARAGSSKTIPSTYGAAPVVSAPVPQKVKNIVWDNNSLNELANNFAKALGYTLVVKGQSVKDSTISFSASNVTLREALEKLKNQVAPVADIVIVDSNKTVNVLYK